MNLSQAHSQFALYLQWPKTKSIGVGVLSVTKAGDARFFSGMAEADSRVLADLQRAKIEFANSEGIMLSGFESNGLDKQGRKKFRYQEWWLAFKTDGNK